MVFLNRWTGWIINVRVIYEEYSMTIVLISFQLFKIIHMWKYSKLFLFIQRDSFQQHGVEGGMSTLEFLEVAGITYSSVRYAYTHNYAIYRDTIRERERLNNLFGTCGIFENKNFSVSCKILFPISLPLSLLILFVT